MLQITTAPHSQSGKEVTKIVVLGRSFDYSDKRGNSMWSFVDREFAKEIISTIPHAVLNQNELRLLDNPEHRFTLSWRCWSPNRQERAEGAKDKYELLIHFGERACHIYTSQKLISQ